MIHGQLTTFGALKFTVEFAGQTLACTCAFVFRTEKQRDVSVRVDTHQSRDQNGQSRSEVERSSIALVALNSIISPQHVGHRFVAKHSVISE